MSKEIYKPKPVSGFPEWLPGYRRLEQQWMDHFRKVFESYGYVNIETPAVEDVNVLQAKGDINKEIYGLHRLLAEEGEASDAKLALHFDLTVPMARYVAQNFNNLDFPFKRYAMQKVWRGERPQKGRMREFYQCDIDVIGVDNLPLHFDAEMPAVMYEIFSGLGFNTQVRISNRKILVGYFQQYLSDAEIVEMLGIIDRLEKDGVDKVYPTLHSGLTNILKDGKYHLSFDPDVVVENIKHMISGTISGITPNAVMQEGLNELSFVMRQLEHLPQGAVVVDLSITRGLDYYTGTVYETKLLDVPEFTGSVCSGGRYDDLAGRFINKHLPGVGISIGLTRMFDVLMQHEVIQPLSPSPTHILVSLPSEDHRGIALETAANLRANGYNVEVAHSADFKKAFRYAERKGIKYMWFPPVDGSAHEVKNLATGEKMNADPKTFSV